MSKNTQEALTIIENKAKVQTCRNKPHVSSSSGSSTQNDVITALTNQVEALRHHISSMQEAYSRNQEAPIQLIQNQMGQMAEDLQERAIRSATEQNRDKTHFLEHNRNYKNRKTITEVVEIPSSQSTPLVPPPETPPLSAPKPKEDLKPNPHQPSIPYPSRLKEEKFHALENLRTGSTNTHSDYSLLDYEAFYFNENHIEEKSSGSTTTHSDFSLPEYDSFIFDLSIDLFPPADMSVSHHEEFADELAHIISPPEYDRFYFDIDIDP
ncbi:hypothetical protein Tco_1048209 [Tanacetum coccineum]